MATQLNFAPQINPEELTGFAPRIANTFTPMGHEQTLAKVVRDWLHFHAMSRLTIFSPSFDRPKVETFLARDGAVGKISEPLAAEVTKAFRDVTGQSPLPCAPREVVSMWRDNNVFNAAGIPSLTFGPPRTREKETNRFCFELADTRKSRSQSPSN